MKKLLVLAAAASLVVFGAYAKVVDLSAMMRDEYTLKDGDVAKKRLRRVCKITIEHGATVTLRDAEINPVWALVADDRMAGIECLGNATIILEGDNVVNALGDDRPGIYVPEGCKVVFEGPGSLKVAGRYRAAGIGGGYKLDCGNIIVNGGVIEASGGYNADGRSYGDFGGPGIGGGPRANCGRIEFNRGVVKAIATGALSDFGMVYGFDNSAIGASDGGTCTSIRISCGIGKIEAEISDGQRSECVSSGATARENGVYQSEKTWGKDEHVIGSVGRRTRTYASVLGRLTGNKTFKDGDEICGQLLGNYRISIAAGARVYFKDVTIADSLRSEMPGITCKGSAIIELAGDSTVKGCGELYPGIFVPNSHHLIIEGDGVLDVYGGGTYGVGIGACATGLGIYGGKIYSGTTVPVEDRESGKIYIFSGTIKAHGGTRASALGGSFLLRSENGSSDYCVEHSDLTDITGGTIYAIGGVPVICDRLTTPTLEDSTGSQYVSSFSLWESIRYIGPKQSGSKWKEEFRWNGRVDNAFEKTQLLALDKTEITGEWWFDESAGGWNEGVDNESTIRIADGATVKIKDLRFGRSGSGPAIRCEGDATIYLEGNDNVISVNPARARKTGFSNRPVPAIEVPMDCSLTIKGTGRLLVYGADDCAAIGGSEFCGDITIEGGTVITKSWGALGRGIGVPDDVDYADCGKIKILGGEVKCYANQIDGATKYPLGGGDVGKSDIVVGSNMSQSYGKSELNEADGIDTPTYKLAHYKWNGKLAGVGDGDGGSVPSMGAPLAKSMPKLGDTGEDEFNLDYLDYAAVAGDKTVITGTLSGSHKIAISDGATVTLRNAVIPGGDSINSQYAGLTCLGNATIVLEGENTIRGFYQSYPAISVPTNCTLAITGTGSLVAGTEGLAYQGAGIGGGYSSNCGSIVISNGTVTAYGGAGSAGIGGGNARNFGSIRILGGVVTATGGSGAAGIGTGCAGGGYGITIGSGVARVVATAGDGTAESVGKGQDGTLVNDSPSIGSILGSTQSGNTRTIQWNGDLGKIYTLFGVDDFELTAYDGTIIRGSTYSNSTGSDKKVKVMIAPGAHVRLQGATINKTGAISADSPFAGITCLGDATITIKDDSLVTKNTVNTFNGDYPAIFVPGGSTLTLEGNGTLEASGRNGTGGAGIGGGSADDAKWCGRIVVDGGDVTAYGGTAAAGIGGGCNGRCDGVVIGAGIRHVYAECGTEGDASALGYGGYGECDTIEVASGVVEDGHGTNFRNFIPNPDTDLSEVGGDTVIATGAIVKGTLAGDYKISLAAGAEVTLNNVNIPGNSSTSCPWAGINCLGDATIWLEGVNVIRGSYDHPGIHVPNGCTLTIKSKNGSGDLKAYGSVYSAGIGGGWALGCGNIVIEGGTIYAEGGEQAAGIGAGTGSSNVHIYSCGDITINGGVVTAKGGSGGCGIGTGASSSCGDITVGSGVTYVRAIRGSSSAVPIGMATGAYSSCGTITLASNLADNPSSDGLQRVIFPNLDLESLSYGDETVVARDGATISGRLGPTRKVAIASGATVTLSNVTIDGVGNDGVDYDLFKWAGLTCLGDATIILEGENYIKGFNWNYPGIHVPMGRTLTIKGSGSLEACSNGYGAGIGGGWQIGCGDIVIEGGTITATGGMWAAGIGGGGYGDCGDITISGGLVTAAGGGQAPGIGAGYDAGCGMISIGGAVKCVVAVCGEDTSGYGEGSPIGPGAGDSVCAGVTVDGSLADIENDRTRTIMNSTMDLAWLTSNFTLQDGMLVSGTLQGDYKVSIAPGAHITLNQATIQGDNDSACPWAGLTCLGDARITLWNYSRLKGFYEDYPGIYVPTGATLTIDGSGGLVAESNGYGAGIGGGYEAECGNIVINDCGGITARGGSYSAGIGGGQRASGDITINGGKVCAYGGYWGAGIGSGNGTLAVSGNITINGGAVVAEGGANAAGIGCGDGAACGTIAIATGITSVTARRKAGAGGNSEHIGHGDSFTEESCAGVVIGPDIEDTVDGDTRALVGPTIVDLSTLTGDTTLADKSIVVGTLSAAYKVSIAAGARVTLRDADINGAEEWTNKSWAGLSCLGDATIVLEGESTVKGFSINRAGIYVPQGTTLTITGDGTLVASALRGSGTYATYGGAGIGGNGGASTWTTSSQRHGGNIVINSGTIYATGGNNSSAIGSSYGNNCGGITINEGIESVTADGGIGKTGGGGTEGTIAISSALERTGNYICHPWDGLLDTLDRNATAKDGVSITGTETTSHEIGVEAGAEVTLDNATILGTLKCNGNATIVLVGANKAAITVKNGGTLTIRGDGSLDAEGEDGWTGTPGICGDGGGNIIIESGTITAFGGGAARGAAAIGGSFGQSCGNITIGPGVTKVVASVRKITAYDNSMGQPIGKGGGSDSSCGTVTIDTANLVDETSEDGLTRTITRKPGVDAANAFDAWKAEMAAAGRSVSGTLQSSNANGVSNVFCYLFDDPDLAPETMLGFELGPDGRVVIYTPEVVNGADLFEIAVVASDDVTGGEGVVVYPLDLDGETVIDETDTVSRFFRIVAEPRR